MNNDLIYAIFKEIAVAEGKRKPDGTWKDGSAAEVQRILMQARGMIKHSEEYFESSKKTE